MQIYLKDNQINEEFVIEASSAKERAIEVLIGNEIRREPNEYKDNDQVQFYKDLYLRTKARLDNLEARIILEKALTLASSSLKSEILQGHLGDAITVRYKHIVKSEK